MAATDEQKKKKKRWNLFKKRRKKGRELLYEEPKVVKERNSPNRSDVTASSSDVNTSFVRNIVSNKRSKRSINGNSSAKSKNTSPSVEVIPPSADNVTAPISLSGPGSEAARLPKDTPKLTRTATTTSGFSPTITDKHASVTSSSSSSSFVKSDGSSTSSGRDQKKKTTAILDNKANEAREPFLNEFDPFEFEGGADETPPQMKDEEWNSFVHQFPSAADPVVPQVSGTSSVSSKDRPLDKTRISQETSMLEQNVQKIPSSVGRKGLEPGGATMPATTKSDPPGTKPVTPVVDEKLNESFTKAPSFCSVTWDEVNDKSTTRTTAPTNDVIAPPKHNTSSPRQSVDQRNNRTKESTQTVSTIGAGDEAGTVGVVDSTKPKTSPKSLKSMARARIAKEAEHAKALRMDHSSETSPNVSLEKETPHTTNHAADSRINPQGDMVAAEKESGRHDQPLQTHESQQSTVRKELPTTATKEVKKVQAQAAVSEPPPELLRTQGPQQSTVRTGLLAATATKEAKKVQEAISGPTPTQLNENALTRTSNDPSTRSLQDMVPTNLVMDVASKQRDVSPTRLKRQTISVTSNLPHDDMDHSHEQDLPFDVERQVREEDGDDRSPLAKASPVCGASDEMKPSQPTCLALDSIPYSSGTFEHIGRSSSFELKRSKQGKGKRRSSSLDIPRKGTPHEVPQLTKGNEGCKTSSASQSYQPPCDKYESIEQDRESHGLTKSTPKASLTSRWSGARTSEGELGSKRRTTRDKLVPRALKHPPPQLTDIVSVHTGHGGEVEMIIPSEDIKNRAETVLSNAEAEPTKYHSDSEFNTTTSTMCSDGSWTLDDESTQETDASNSASVHSEECRSHATDVTEDSRSHYTNDTSDSRSYATNDSYSYDSRTYDSRSSYMTRSHTTYDSYDSRTTMTNMTANSTARTSLTNDSSLRSYLSRASRSTRVARRRDFISDEESSSDEETNKEEDAVDSYLWEKIADTLILGHPWKG